MTGTLMLDRLVRPDIARELTFTGRIFDAEEGHRLGLVTRLSDDPFADAMGLAAEIAARNPEAVRAAKRLLTTTAHAGFAEQFAAERREIAALIGRPNQVEAITANLESRSPVFSD
jgi:enoyl-CoA hydratase/carnithine racemase